MRIVDLNSGKTCTLNSYSSLWILEVAFMALGFWPSLFFSRFSVWLNINLWCVIRIVIELDQSISKLKQNPIEI